MKMESFPLSMVKLLDLTTPIRASIHRSKANSHTHKMKKILTPCLFALVAITLTVSPQAYASLLRAPNKTYSYDTSTGLAWLDVGITSNISYADFFGSNGNVWRENGWRLATGAELSTLFNNNLSALTKSPPRETNGAPAYGGSFSDFYAARQQDPRQEVANLIETLGGKTIDLGLGSYGIIGIIDRASECIGGCSAHAPAALVAYSDGTSEAYINGGVSDTFSHPWYGKFLVSSSTPTIPEPDSYFLAAAGIFIIAARNFRTKS
jgi:hypothetical protein